MTSDTHTGEAPMSETNTEQERKPQWFSFRRGPLRMIGLGVWLGRSRTDRTFCFLIQIGTRTLALGPHLPADRRPR